MILQGRLAMVAGWIQRHQQQALTALLAENRVLKAPRGGRRRRLTDTERRRLAVLAHPLGRTRLRWDTRLIAPKCDGSPPRRQWGRPRGVAAGEQRVMRLAEENPAWGSRRMPGAGANRGHPLDTLPVRHLLRRHPRAPAPHRRKPGMRWAQCLQMHGAVLAATAFCTVAVATWPGLVTSSGLVGRALATRRVQRAGIPPPPTAAFMQQCARQRTDPGDGVLLRTR